MNDILKTILGQKRLEVQKLRGKTGIASLRGKAAEQAPPRGFARALDARVAANKAAIIAEIKRASPSRGVIREDFRPAWLATDYQRGGAACLSVLTDEDFFQGAEAHLVEARSACTLPVIRKDFVVDEIQVVQARAMGADAVLLIVAALSVSQMFELEAAASELRLDVLVEIHDAAELDQFMKAALPPGVLLGVNNRNLRTFETTLDTTLDLLPRIPEGISVVTESGIASPADIQRLRDAGVQRFLVGESLMRQDSPGEALKALLA